MRAAILIALAASVPAPAASSPPVASPPAAPVPDETIVAEAGGEKVTAARLRARMAHLRALGTDAPPAGALEQLIDDVLAAGEARRRGVRRQ